MTVPKFLKSEKILKWLATILYGVPAAGSATRQSLKWLYNFAASVVLLLGMWFSFSFHVYCIKTYWRSDLKPKIPIETLLLMVPLNLSGAISYTLMMWYFYRNEFSHSKRLVPHHVYMPDGSQEEVGPSENDWKYVNIFLFFGILSVLLVLYFAFGQNVFMDFRGLHDFTHNMHVHAWTKDVYYFSVAFINWGFISVVIACCVFYLCCQDIIRHIEHTEQVILTNAKNYLRARHYHDCLLKYTDSIMGSVKVWFTTHSLFFMFIVVSVAFEWITYFSHKKHYDKVWIIYLSQAAGTFLIAFKFAFPIISASRVTAKFEMMYRNINRQWHPDEPPQVGAFLNYCYRCEAGFTLFGIKLTAQLALISLLSCFVGFFKLYKKLY